MNEVMLVIILILVAIILAYVVYLDDKINRIIEIQEESDLSDMRFVSKYTPRELYSESGKRNTENRLCATCYYYTCKTSENPCNKCRNLIGYDWADLYWEPNYCAKEDIHDEQTDC